MNSHLFESLCFRRFIFGVNDGVLASPATRAYTLSVPLEDIQATTYDYKIPQRHGQTRTLRTPISGYEKAPHRCYQADVGCFLLRGSYRDRTDDLLGVNELLYQLS